MPRRTLTALAIALCSGAAQAQYAGGSVPGGASAASEMSAPPPSVSGNSASAGSGLDLQPASPSKSGCDRLKNENILNSGGLMSEDMQAKTEYCKWSESIPMPQ